MAYATSPHFMLLILIYVLSSNESGSKWRASTRETEVRLDGWCEGGFGQQRNDRGFCASMRERSESPATCVTE